MLLGDITRHFSLSTKIFNLDRNLISNFEKSFAINDERTIYSLAVTLCTRYPHSNGRTFMIFTFWEADATSVALHRIMIHKEVQATTLVHT